jgi:hypothetical protein
MIIQTAPPHQPHRVIYQTDHAAMSGQFAAAFGNEQFAGLSPHEPMVYVAAHHDDGWTAVDARAEQDPNTGLPYHLTQTPLPYLIETSAGSPAANEAYHPYSGLLSSMHSYGLFHGRYGLSDKIFIDLVPADHKTAVQAMLDGELARQGRLKALLANMDGGWKTEDGERSVGPRSSVPGPPSPTAVLIQEDVLFHNYKLLQFFDTLALYFHMTHAAARSESHFTNVPRAVGDDVGITISPVGDNISRLAPYPFVQNEMEFSYNGRFLSPQPPGTDLAALLAQTPLVVEKITLTA